jgi:hypothetical protein
MLEWWAQGSEERATELVEMFEFLSQSSATREELKVSFSQSKPRRHIPDGRTGQGVQESGVKIYF